MKKVFDLCEDIVDLLNEEGKSTNPKLEFAIENYPFSLLIFLLSASITLP
jgi:hypothetical protein